MEAVEGKKGRGGARPGAGRRKDPIKDVKLGATSALRILNALGDVKATEKLAGHEKALAALYQNCGDSRTRTMIIFRLRDMAFGKPSQSLELEGKVDTTMKVEVEFIGGDA